MGSNFDFSKFNLYGSKSSFTWFGVALIHGGYDNDKITANYPRTSTTNMPDIMSGSNDKTSNVYISNSYHPLDLVTLKLARYWKNVKEMKDKGYVPPRINRPGTMI